MLKKTYLLSLFVIALFGFMRSNPAIAAIDCTLVDVLSFCGGDCYYLPATGRDLFLNSVQNFCYTYKEPSCSGSINNYGWLRWDLYLTTHHCTGYSAISSPISQDAECYLTESACLSCYKSNNPTLNIGCCYPNCQQYSPEPPVPDCPDKDNSSCKICSGFGGLSGGGSPSDGGSSGGGLGGGFYNPFTGGVNFILSLFDLPKMSPAPSIQLYYNNQNNENSVLGPGWSHTYLSFLSFANQSNTDSSVSLKKPSGVNRNYNYSHANGNYTGTNSADRNNFVALPNGNYQLNKSDGEKWIYEDINNSWELKTVEDSNGKQLNLFYSSANLLESVEDDYGRQLLFSYDTNNKLQSVTDPGGSSYGFTYQNGKLTGITYPDERHLTLSYDTSSGNLLSVIDDTTSANVVVAEFQYNTNNQCTRYNADGENYKRDISYSSSDAPFEEFFENFESTSWEDLQADGWVTGLFNQNNQKTDELDFVNETGHGTVVKMESTNSEDAILSRNFTGRQKVTVNFKLKREQYKKFELQLISQDNIYNGVCLVFDTDGAIKAKYHDLPGEAYNQNLKRGFDFTLPLPIDNDIATYMTSSYGVWQEYKIEADTEITTSVPETGRIRKKQTFTLYQKVNANAPWRVSSNSLFNVPAGQEPINKISKIRFIAPKSTNGNNKSYVDEIGVGDSNSYSRIITDSRDNQSFFRLEKTASGYEMKKEGCASCGSSTKTYAFDANFNNTQIIDANGNKTQMTYDSAGNMLSKSEAVGTSEQITKTYAGYHPTLLKPLTVTSASVVQSPGNKTTIYDYDNDHDTNYNQSPTPNLGQLVETGYTRNASGSAVSYTYTTKYTYNTDKQLTLIEGPRTGINDNISFTYYANESGQGNNRGSLHTVAYPYGTYTYENYDPNHNVRRIIDPNGLETSYTYDSMGRVATITTGTGTNPPVTHYYYTPAGTIDHIVMPEGNIVAYEYDTVNRIVDILLKDSSGTTKAKIHYTYDTEGNKTREEYQDPAQNQTLRKFLDFQYDELNRLKKITQPDTYYTSFSYDGNGNITQKTDPLAIVTGYTSYDALNRLKTIIQAQGTSDSATTNYTYDAHGNLTQVTDAEGKVTTYVYDDMGRIVNSVATLLPGGTSPNTVTTRYVYDEAGNLVTKVEGAGTTFTRTIYYEYDAANRLVEIDYPTDQDVTFTYDETEFNNVSTNGIGRLTTMTDQSGTIRYFYDERGNVVQDKRTIDSTDYAVSYAYNLNNTRTGMTYRAGATNQRVITYSVNNALQRPTSIIFTTGSITVASNINYEPFGGVSSMSYGNGQQITVTHNQQYQIEELQSGSVLNRSYTYDGMGNITEIDRSGKGIRQYY